MRPRPMGFAFYASHLLPAVVALAGLAVVVWAYNS